MPRVDIAPRADDDAIEIWGYVAADNPFAADRLLDSFKDRYLFLAANPKAGPQRFDLRADLRYFPVGRYLILYREIADGVEIVRVVHGARNLQILDLK